MSKIDLKKVVFKEIDSTNNYAKSIGKTEKSDMLIIADSQTAGKGRMGRSFFSPDGGIYMSLLLHPCGSVKNIPDITAMASVAVSRAIKNIFNLETGIKWVNDIYYNGKKVCGILTEGSYNSEKGIFDYAILGVGLNLIKPENGFPDDIKAIAGYLLERGDNELKQKFITEFVDCFYDIYEGEKDFFGEYKSRSIVLGKRIEYIKNNGKFYAEAIDINENFELIVSSESGTAALNSGEIKICVESLM